MFTHVMIGANDIAQSRAFYDATFAAINVPTFAEREEMALYGDFAGGLFVVGKPRDGKDATHANGGTIGLKAASQAEVDAWYAAGMANGGSCEGEPGRRDWGDSKSYGAYLRDPVGNKLYAVTRNVED